MITTIIKFILNGRYEMKNKKKEKKINKSKIIFIGILSIIIFLSVVVLGRYISNEVKEVYLSSKGFFFKSDKLRENMPIPTYKILNWSGIGKYEINFELHSYKNELEKAEYDMEYIVNCEPNDKLNWQINNNPINTEYSGIIYKNKNVDNITLTISPKGTLGEEENIDLVVNAISQNPYKKKISAKFKIKISNQKLNYQIEDFKQSGSAKVIVRNPKDTVNTMTLEFDPNLIRIDSNNNLVKNSKKYTTQKIADKDGKEIEYINSVTFDLPAETTKKIIFYKVDKSKDYTYPNSSNKSIINVK